MSADPCPVLEQAVVTPVFCDGLHAIDIDRHGIARLTLYAEQRETCTGTMERVVAARLILPAAVVSEIAGQMLAAHRTPKPSSERRSAIN